MPIIERDGNDTLVIKPAFIVTAVYEFLKTKFNEHELGDIRRIIFRSLPPGQEGCEIEFIAPWITEGLFLHLEPDDEKIKLSIVAGKDRMDKRQCGFFSQTQMYQLLVQMIWELQAKKKVFLGD